MKPFFRKIIQLVQSAQSEKSPSQLFIERFEGTYVKVVLLSWLLMLFLPYFLLGWSWHESFYRAMILLVVASPCALVGFDHASIVIGDFEWGQTWDISKRRCPS